MAKVTNTTTVPLEMLVKGWKVKNGIPETVGIAPGETAEVDLDLDHAHTKGHIIAGALLVSDVVQERVARSVEGSHSGAATAQSAKK